MVSKLSPDLPRTLAFSKELKMQKWGAVTVSHLRVSNPCPAENLIDIQASSPMATAKAFSLNVMPVSKYYYAQHAPRDATLTMREFRALHRSPRTYTLLRHVQPL